MMLKTNCNYISHSINGIQYEIIEMLCYSAYYDNNLMIIIKLLLLFT